jgi:hypothetical protein
MVLDFPCVEIEALVSSEIMIEEKNLQTFVTFKRNNYGS